jgi:Fe(II)/alpha-ketoglutarate-dependent arginine beta-hydroxylase
MAYDQRNPEVTVSILLTEQENVRIQQLLDQLVGRFSSAENPEFLAEATVFAHELPRRLRQALNEFRLFESAPYCSITGYPISDQAIGHTPGHWKERQRRCNAVREELLLVVLGSLLGDVIAWATQQDGAVVHDIAPISGHEHEQLGSGSAEELTWHTEDAFHPFRGDYLGMLCLRNPDRVPTTLAAPTAAEIDAELLPVLFEPHFTIRPDKSHLRKNRGSAATCTDLEAAHDRIEEMDSRPAKVPVLFGSLESPYYRLDPYFMDPPELPVARQALEQLIQVINRRLEDLVFEPGQFCFIDNFKAVHGRKPFKARFDGTDRWMKRINITRNLRSSRTARPAPESRLLT